MHLRRPTPVFRTVLFAAAWLTAAPPALAQDAPPVPAVTAAFDQAAAGAEVIVIVPQLSELGEKSAAFAEQTQLDTAALAGVFSNPLNPVAGPGGMQATPLDFANGLDAFKRKMGWLEGVDDDGSGILVLYGVADYFRAVAGGAGGQAPRPTAVLLVPTTDYPAFVTQLGGDPQADATAIDFNTPDGRKESGFAKSLNGYAALSEKLETLQNYQPANQAKALTDAMSPLLKTYLNTGQSLVYIDVAALAESLNLVLDDKEKQARAFAPAMLEAAGPALELYFDQLRSVINGTDRALLSLDFNDAGLGLTASLQAKAGSDLADYLKPADADAPANSGRLLAALPDQPYLYASSVDPRGIAVDRIIEQIEAALGPADADAAGASLLLRDALLRTKNTRGLASAFYRPDPRTMLAGGITSVLTLYDVEDPDAFVAQHRAAIEKLAQTKFTLPAAQQGQPDTVVSFNTQYIENALNIEGTGIHQFQVNTVLPPEALQQFGPLAMVMGNAGSGGYLAVKDGKVLVTNVVDAQLITQSLRAIDQNTGIGAAGPLAELRSAAFPVEPSMELYISLGNIIDSTGFFLPFLLPGLEPVNVPADLPPLALGGVSDEQSIALRIFLPHPLVEFASNLNQQLAPAIQQRQRQRGNRAPRTF
ncbi:MAG: hypothetical protein AAGG38_11995 [Planctomycetota bacterium]